MNQEAPDSTIQPAQPAQPSQPRSEPGEPPNSTAQLEWLSQPSQPPQPSHEPGGSQFNTSDCQDPLAPTDDALHFSHSRYHHVPQTILPLTSTSKKFGPLQKSWKYNAKFLEQLMVLQALIGHIRKVTKILRNKSIREKHMPGCHDADAMMS